MVYARNDHEVLKVVLLILTEDINLVFIIVLKYDIKRVIMMNIHIHQQEYLGF